MDRKLACVVYLSSYVGSLARVEARLLKLGYEVHSFEVSKDRADAIVAGDKASLPDALRDCLEQSELCVLLIDESAGSLGTIGGLSSDLGCRVVTVGKDLESLPIELDDIADGHLPDVDHQKADEVLGGERVRINVDGTELPLREPKRQKCQ
jgi:hypothetical protein